VDQFEEVFTQTKDEEQRSAFIDLLTTATGMEDGRVQVHCPTFGLLSFNRLPVATGEAAAELELMDGSLLVDHGDEFRITTKEDRIYHFPKDRVATDQHTKRADRE
jgi:hypothetical protein